MTLLTSAFPATSGGPELRALVGGFGLMVIGLAALTLRRDRRESLRSPQATRRALAYALVYGLCAACFARLVSPALLGHVRSPWLYALGDVMFVTLSLFVWVMVLAEDLSPRDLGVRGAPPARFVMATLLGLAAAAVYAFGPLRHVAAIGVTRNPDALVFVLLASLAGSAMPEELLFRGFLMSSLDGRARRWARVAVPALAFTLVRAFRYLPGVDLAVDDWWFYVLGTALPLGLWWGVLRDLSGGSILPGLISHLALEVSWTLAGTSGR
jgi:membrane protease YdiL (CAAX protease family)